MKAIHWIITVTYNFEKKVNQKVNLLRRPPPAHLDIAILKKKKKKTSKTLLSFLLIDIDKVI